MKKNVLLAALVVLAAHALGSAGILDSANARYNQADMAGALKLYKQALQSNENRTLVYFNLGNVYYQLDSVPQAIVCYRSCLASAPDFFRGYMNLAIMYFAMEDEPGVIATLQRALRLEPTNSDALMLLATAYRNAGSLSDAAVYFERVTIENPRAADALLMLGEVYWELGDGERALNWLVNYPQDGDKIGRAQLLMADIAQAQDNGEQALFYLQRAASHLPQNRWIVYRMVQMLIAQQKPLVALQEVMQGMAQFPDFTELALLGGALALSEYRLDSAEMLYASALRQGSPEAVVGLENIRIVRLQKVTGAVE